MKTVLLRVGAVLCIVLASCAGGAEPDPPSSLAFADSSTTATPVLPEELDVADLPASLADRLSTMNQWLRRHEPALNSGHGLHSADPGGNFSVEQFINTTDRDEAERLCPLYVAASEFFAGSTGSPGEVVLTGWALGDDGQFFEPGWTPISCDLKG